METARSFGPYLYISLGAILGANLRYLTARWLAHAWGSGFPYGTFAVNIFGSFVIGLLGTLLVQRSLPHAEIIRFGLIVGFLGSLTTFSGLTWETSRLMGEAAWFRASLNVLLSVAVGLGAVRLGEVAVLTFVARG